MQPVNQLLFIVYQNCTIINRKKRHETKVTITFVSYLKYELTITQE
ncbi:hypothetical protein RV15_GL000129 [Enterococcus silesiacus]|uniref:Uncharacterized protein n=1 Tax=Enterococcus silesiacus TaxID=332949 RepID=A0AA91GKK2_9ENTE|nr:hypothetical protein RV15_GL000129 [Enterococcus silesiacus]